MTRDQKQSLSIRGDLKRLQASDHEATIQEAKDL